MQAGQSGQPDPILSSPKPGCQLRPCLGPSLTPPVSTGRSSAPSAGSAPTTTTTSSVPGTPAVCPPVPHSRHDHRDGAQLSLVLTGGAISRHGISLLFFRQIPGAAGGLQGGGHRPPRPRQLEGEEEQGVQCAGEGSGAGVGHPRTDSTPPHYPLPVLCLFWVCFSF